MPQVIPVDLIKTGGKLTLPGVAADPPPAAPGGSGPNVPAPTEHPTQPPEAAQPPPPTPPKPCTHCGMDPTTDPTEVTDDDRTEFVKAVLTGTAFAREFSLFGGAVKVRFRTLGIDETDAMQFALDRLDATGSYPQTPQGAAARFHAAVALNAAIGSERVVVGGTVHTRPADATPEAALAWMKGVLRQEPVFAAVREAFLHFAAVSGAIQRKALDPSFFTATAGRGSSPASPPPANRS